MRAILPVLILLALAGCRSADEARRSAGTGAVSQCRASCNGEADRCLDSGPAAHTPAARQTGTPTGPLLGPTADCSDSLRSCLTACGSER